MANVSMLGHWSAFYAMTGSSSAALVGLMFIVITLVTGDERAVKNPDGISTFSTPTVIHFGTALLVSAIMLVPWHVIVCSAAALAVMGIGGVVYLVRVSMRASRLLEYRADLEDWIWYSVLPFVAYTAMAVAGLMLAVGAWYGFYAVAGSTVLLIFIGIRNAWDVVTFLATGGPSRSD